MFNIQKYLRHAVLALGMAAVSLTASATVLPTYKIAATDTVASDIAYIDFLFVGVDDAAAVTASLSHFSGISLSDLDREGAVAGTGNPFTIGNDVPTFNYLLLEVNGPFAFDLNFSEGFLNAASTFGAASYFSMALYDSSFNFIGSPEGALQFSLSKSGVDVTSTTSVLSVTEVPEPADWMLMLTGLVFVVYLTRKNGRADARLASA